VTFPRFSPRSALAAALLSIALCATIASAQSAADLGRPVVLLIDELREQDFRIIYSQELVPARLTVTVVPEGGTALERLREVLAPHGLGIEIGPRDTWLVVRDASAAIAAAAAASVPAPVRPPLETIVVTASRYAIDRPTATSATEITRQTLENTTVIGQDPLRATQQLPGVSGNQLNAQAHVRGGALDEVLLRLDGVSLYNPYHLKDFQTVFSGINLRVVESMDVRTGGYEARFGDRMSGVVDMASVTPTEPRHFELGLSMLESSVLSSGVFADGRGAWLTTLRRGNLDVLADEMDSDIGQPQYVDFFNKLAFAVSPRSTLAAGMLSLDDKISLNDAGIATATADYADRYYWLTLSRSGDGGLESELTISSAKLIRTRNGSIDDPSRVIGTLADTSTLDRLSLTGDFEYPVSEMLHIAYGFEIDALDLHGEAAINRSFLLDIRSDDLSARNAPPAFARVAHDQTRRAIYMSYRLRPAGRLALELGGRYDEQSLTGQSQTSPRLNLLFDFTPRTSLRAAWGRYDQSQSLDTLALADGETGILPVEKSEHAVLGIEHRFGESGTVRIEAYDKDVSRLNRRFENIFERVSLIPELLPDRFEIDASSAIVRGIEVGVDGTTGAFRWWGNFARARTEDRLPTGSFERGWDEEWSVKAGGDWEGADWTLSASATLRSGWPITGLQLVNDELVAGSYNALRLPDFTSLDVRANRRVATERGELNWFIEISNLLDHENYCCLEYDYSPASGSGPASLAVSRDALLGIVPNVGMRWEF
jgi:outer membrane cobalamin receptor